MISTSVGYGFTHRMPVSFLAQRTFEYIAQEGRDGKGTLLFFSAGNSNSHVSSERPWGGARLKHRRRRLDAGQRRQTGPGILQQPPRRRALRAIQRRPAQGLVDRLGQIRRHFVGDTVGGRRGGSGAGRQARADAHPGARDLRSSARQIDADPSDPLTVWRNARKMPAGPDEDKVYSNAFGFGEIQAAAAVQAALDYKAPAEEPGRTTSGSIMGVSKQPPPVASSADGSSFPTVSLILMGYHLVIALLILLAGSVTDPLLMVAVRDALWSAGPFPRSWVPITWSSGPF